MLKSLVRGVLLLLPVLLLIAPTANAQNARIEHVIEELPQQYNKPLGRDHWFAIPRNLDYGADVGKFFDIYIASEKKTVVNIQVKDGPLVSKPLGAGAVLRHPLDWTTEMFTSGTSEKKSIHVWSKDADLSVYLLSRNSFTS